MIGIEQRLAKIDTAKDMKPLRKAPWANEVRELVRDWPGETPLERVCHIDHVCGEIVRAEGFKAFREDVWRALRFEQISQSRLA